MHFPRHCNTGRSLSLAACLWGYLPVMFTSLMFTSTAWAAGSSCVHFDVPQMVTCRPVNSCEVAVNDHEQAVEAIFDVSTLLRFGQEAEVRQLLFVVESPAGTLRVVDFAKTELTSLYVGQIERSRQQEESNNVGLSATVSPAEFLNAQGNTSRAVKANETIRFQTLPPMQLLAASGTVSRGAAVYFKFKATPQTTLDGSRPLRVLFRVPSGWRGDYVYLRCVAYAEATSDQQSPICGSTDFLVPLYLEGDDVARQASLQLAQREYALRQLAQQWQLDSHQAHGASLSDKLTALFRDEKSRVPELWLTTVLTSPPSRRDFSFQTRLPQDLRRAGQRLHGRPLATSGAQSINTKRRWTAAEHGAATADIDNFGTPPIE